eukprot:g2215.t1
MLALSPAEWLTASGTTQTMPSIDFGGQQELSVVYDNGKKDVGVVSKGCSFIDWGPPQPAKSDLFRFAWALPCNQTTRSSSSSGDSDDEYRSEHSSDNGATTAKTTVKATATAKATAAAGWTIASISDDGDYAFVAVRYSGTENIRGQDVPFIGCLDRAPVAGGQSSLAIAPCSMLAGQRWIRRRVAYAGIPMQDGGPFVLHSYDDPTQCIDITQGIGPTLQMYRCKGIRPAVGHPGPGRFVPSVPMTSRDTCASSYPALFTEPLDNIQCAGLTSYPTANTSDACAAACCHSPQGSEHCEAWQWSSTAAPAASCWIGKCNSAVPNADNPGQWTGRGRPTPNQMFYLDCNISSGPGVTSGASGCALASVQDWTSPVSSSTAHPTCLRVQAQPPDGFVRHVPANTPIVPSACENAWNQQWMYYGDTDQTLRQLHDDDSCLDGAGDGPGSYSMKEHTWGCYDKPGTFKPEIAILNQQWRFDPTTKWLQMPSTVLDHEVVPIAACLTVRVRAGPMGDDLSEIVRAPCRGGNATGLNRVNMSAAALDPMQQWEMNARPGGGNLRNIGSGRCAAIAVGSHWIRAGEPVPDDTISHVAVKHDLDSCMGCSHGSSAPFSVSGSGYGSASAGGQCAVGDSTAIGSCRNPGQAAVRWQYSLAPTSAPTPAAVTDTSADTDADTKAKAQKLPPATCIRGVNLAFHDLPNMPVRDLTAEQCQNLCATDVKCQAYVYLTKGCDHQPSDACYLKDTNNVALETTDSCSCFGAKPFSPPQPMCPSMFVPAHRPATALPYGSGCSVLRKREDCCQRLDGSDSPYFGQRCVPPKADTFRASASATVTVGTSVCEPLGWVTNHDSDNQGTCAHTAACA